MLIFPPKYFNHIQAYKLPGFKGQIGFITYMSEHSVVHAIIFELRQMKISKCVSLEMQRFLSGKKLQYNVQNPMPPTPVGCQM